MANTNRLPRIGDVYFMCFDGTGNEQTGWRPGVVFQNNTGNRYSPNIVALPVTSSLKKTGQPTHVLLLASETGLPKDSMVLCENPKCMSKDKIGNYITSLSPKYMQQIAIAHILASSAISFIEYDILSDVWHKARSLNAT